VKQQESWSIWEPLQDLPSYLHFERLQSDSEGLRIYFIDPKVGRILVVYFERFVSYRNTDEGFRLRTWQTLSEQSQWPLFKIQNSHMLQWLYLETESIYTQEQLPNNHYAFTTGEDIVDVVSYDEPNVFWFEPEYSI